MRNTRAIFLAAALLTGLPVAAYSQGTQAPADAFLYIVWPPDGTTVKGAFWCRLAFATWVLPRQAVLPPTAVIIIC
jgi:hypothetical protein